MSPCCCASLSYAASSGVEAHSHLLTQNHSMNLRLFTIKKPNGFVVKDLFFSNKKAAKEERDRLNSAEGPGHTVTNGPDHRRAKTH